MPPQPPVQSVPDGWDVVESPSQTAQGSRASNRAAATPGAASVPDGWEVADAPEAPTNWMGGLSATAAAGAAALPALRGVAERVATSPALGGTASALAARLAAPLNVGKQLYDVATGKQSALDAAKDAALGEGARRIFRPERMIRAGAQLAQRVAAPIANALGAEGVAGMAAPVAVPVAGGLAGVAGTAGFLGALQHDANRHVDIDYTRNTPDTDIAKVFINMRNSEANRGRSVDERMDDPNDVMFRPDDAMTVTPEMARAAILAKLQGTTQGAP